MDVRWGRGASCRCCSPISTQLRAPNPSSEPPNSSSEPPIPAQRLPAQRPPSHSTDPHPRAQTPSQSTDSHPRAQTPIPGHRPHPSTETPHPRAQTPIRGYKPHPRAQTPSQCTDPIPAQRPLLCPAPGLSPAQARGLRQHLHDQPACSPYPEGLLGTTSALHQY